jgi:hypothetical protein
MKGVLKSFWRCELFCARGFETEDRTDPSSLTLVVKCPIKLSGRCRANITIRVAAPAAADTKTSRAKVSELSSTTDREKMVVRSCNAMNDLDCAAHEYGNRWFLTATRDIEK